VDVGLLIALPSLPFQTNQPYQLSNANNGDDTDGDHSEASNSVSDSNEASDDNDDQSDIAALIRRAKSKAGPANDRGKKAKHFQGKGQISRSGSGTPSGGRGRNRGGEVNLSRLSSISGVSKIGRQRRRPNRGRARGTR